MYIYVAGFYLLAGGSDTITLIPVSCISSKIKKIPGKQVTHPTCHKAKCVTHYEVTLLKSKTPAVLQYLREEQSPVVFPAAVLTQDVRLFVHQPLLIVDSSLLLIAQHRIQLSQHLEGGGELM